MGQSSGGIQSCEGIPERRTPDYRRNGTTPLFAAPDIATGSVIGKCCGRHRSKEFPDFPKEIGTRVPKGSDGHIVFSKAGLFSGLNNLRDITLSPAYGTIGGYMDDDLDTVFAPEL